MKLAIRLLFLLPVYCRSPVHRWELSLLHLCDRIAFMLLHYDCIVYYAVLAALNSMIHKSRRVG